MNIKKDDYINLLAMGIYKQILNSFENNNISVDESDEIIETVIMKILDGHRFAKVFYKTKEEEMKKKTEKMESSLPPQTTTPTSESEIEAVAQYLGVDISEVKDDE